MSEAVKNAVANLIPPAAKQAWQGLPARDQSAVKIMAGVLVFAILYFAIWAPIQSAQSEAQRKHDSAKKEWEWLNAQITQLESRKNQTRQANINSQSRLTAYAQQQLRLQNIFSAMDNIAPVNKRNSAGIEITFKQVQAPAFFRWLSKMEKEGVVATAMDVRPVKTGLIQASVTFEVPK